MTLCNVWARSRWKVRALHTSLAVADLASVDLSLILRRGPDILHTESGAKLIWIEAASTRPRSGGNESDIIIWVTRRARPGVIVTITRGRCHLARGHTPGLLRIEATISIISIIAEPKL